MTRHSKPRAGGCTAEGKTKYSLEMWAPGGAVHVTLAGLSQCPKSVFRLDGVTLCCPTPRDIQSGSNKTVEEVQVTTIQGCVKVLLLGCGGLLCLQDCEFL